MPKKFQRPEPAPTDDGKKARYPGPYLDGTHLSVSVVQALAAQCKNGGTTAMDPFCRPPIPASTKQAAFVGDWNPNGEWSSRVLPPDVEAAMRAYEAWKAGRRG